MSPRQQAAGFQASIAKIRDDISAGDFTQACELAWLQVQLDQANTATREAQNCARQTAVLQQETDQTKTKIAAICFEISHSDFSRAGALSGLQVELDMVLFRGKAHAGGR
jgi:hypothetical protein